MFIYFFFIFFSLFDRLTMKTPRCLLLFIRSLTIEEFKWELNWYFFSADAFVNDKCYASICAMCTMTETIDSENEKWWKWKTIECYNDKIQKSEKRCEMKHAKKSTMKMIIILMIHSPSCSLCAFVYTHVSIWSGKWKIKHIYSEIDFVMCAFFFSLFRSFSLGWRHWKVNW